MKKILVFAGAATLVAASAFWGACDHGGRDRYSSKAVQRHYEEGSEDLYAYRFDSATKKLAKAAELDPTFAEAAIARAYLFSLQGDIDNEKRAIARADSLTALVDNESRRMVAQLRLCYSQESQYFPLRDSLIARLEVERPNDIHVLEAMALRAEHNGDTIELEHILKAILKQAPNYARGYNWLGYCELNRGNYDAAMEHFQKYGFLAPTLANPHDSLGEVLMDTGRYEEAEKEFLTALTLQPGFVASVTNLGELYISRGHLAKGTQIMDELRQQVAGTELEIRVDLAAIRALSMAGLEDEARNLRSRVGTKYPGQKHGRFYRALGLVDAGNVIGATAVMDSALAEWRGALDYTSYSRTRADVESASYQFQGYVADQRGDCEAGARLWEAAEHELAGVPMHARWLIVYRKAFDLLQCGHPEQAIEANSQLLGVNPRMIGPLVLQARCLDAIGDCTGADVVWSQLAEDMKDSDPEYLMRRRVDELRSGHCGR